MLEANDVCVRCSRAGVDVNTCSHQTKHETKLSLGKRAGRRRGTARRAAHLASRQTGVVEECAARARPLLRRRALLRLLRLRRRPEERGGGGGGGSSGGGGGGGGPWHGHHLGLGAAPVEGGAALASHVVAALGAEDEHLSRSGGGPRRSADRGSQARGSDRVGAGPTEQPGQRRVCCVAKAWKPSSSVASASSRAACESCLRIGYARGGVWGWGEGSCNIKGEGRVVPKARADGRRAEGGGRRRGEGQGRRAEEGRGTGTEARGRRAGRWARARRLLASYVAKACLEATLRMVSALSSAVQPTPGHAR